MKSIGKRRRSGGGESVFEKVLARRIEECSCMMKKNGGADELADHLRATFPEYKRHKVLPFKRHIQQALQRSDSRKRIKISDSSGSEEEDETLRVMDDDDDAVKPKNMELEVVNKEEGDRDTVVDALGINSDGPRFTDLGGMSALVDELMLEVILPLCHPQLNQTLGVKPFSGILFHGPPGCGKTTLAHAIANEAGVPFYKISSTELVSGISGASEENIRDLFLKAYDTAPSIVFIDEIDAISSKRENLQRAMEGRIVTQLMACMDEHSRPGYVLVIGATNRPDAIDSALRRPGRFDHEIALGVPDENARVAILSILTRSLKVEGDFDLVKIARSTPGFVGADLEALVKKAGNLALKRIVDQRKKDFSREPMDGEHTKDVWRHPWSHEEMERLSIVETDFEEAAKMVQPSSRREGFSAIPNVKWEDVGGLDFLRQEFDRYIIRPLKYPEKYVEAGVKFEIGILLHGPPGCGKTLIAKALANESGANFIHIKGPELLNKYVGESELAVRTIFLRARTCSPCIIFFDEVDALTTEHGNEGGSVVEKVLKQLLIELDGGDHRRDVYVIGATNRLDVMDPAIIRSGRFGKHLYVPLPSPDARGLILKALARKKPIDASVDLIAIGRNEACKNLSGADLALLMDEAAITAVEENLQSVQSSSDSPSLTINAIHLERALEKISLSVSDKAKSEAKKWMSKPVNYHDKLVELFAKDRATSEGAETTKEKKRRWANSTVEDGSNTINAIDLDDEVTLENFGTDLGDGIDMMFNQVPSQYHDATPLKGKKKKVSHNEYENEVLKCALDNVAMAIRERNAIIRESRPRVYSESEIFEELMAIGVHSHMIDEAYIFLAQNLDKAKIVFGCPFERRLTILKKIMHDARLM